MGDQCTSCAVPLPRNPRRKGSLCRACLYPILGQFLAGHNGPAIKQQRAHAWCPPAYRPVYDALIRKHVKAAEARQIIEEQIRSDRILYFRTGRLQMLHKTRVEA